MTVKARPARRPLLATLAALALAGAAALPGGGCGGGNGSATSDAATGVDAGAGGDGDASRGDADTVDCQASCDRIAAICAGVSTIDDNWLSICRQNCGVRAAVQPDEARAEAACTAAAPDCTTAILCSVDPLGGDR